MEYTIAELRSLSPAPIALWVLKENYTARAFYGRMGFQADGAEKNMAHPENAAVVRYRCAA